MYSKLSDWSNGWFGVELALKKEEIDRLITLLEGLKSDPEQHFHLSSDYRGEGGLGDIEISGLPDDAPSNMSMSGMAIAPGSPFDEKKP